MGLHLPTLVSYQTLLFALPIAASALGKWGVGSGHREAFLLLAMAQLLWGAMFALSGMPAMLAPTLLYCGLDVRAYLRSARRGDRAQA